MSTLLVILILSVLVIIHELGHWIAALWAGIKADEFGLGYPPKARHLFTYKGTDFTLNWVPFGGFVRMRGEDSELETSPQPGEYRAATLSRRIIVITAGVLMNFLFGIIIFSSIFTFTGIPQSLNGEPRIAATAPDSPAAQAGLPTDVSVVAIDAGEGRVETPAVKNVQAIIVANRGTQLTMYTTGHCEGLSCAESEQSYQVYVRTEAETPVDQGSIGVVFSEEVLVKHPLWQMPFRGAWFGTTQAIQLGYDILRALSQLLFQLITTGSVPTDVVGPIGIADQAQQFKLAEQGIVTSLIFAAMISINLAIMNILPIPPLDGGKLLFLLLEPFFNKRKLAKVEYWFNYSGFVLLIGMIILISVRDVWSIVSR